MKTNASVVTFSISHPRLVTAIVVMVTIMAAVLAGLPSLLPAALPMLSPITIDTDPENMLDKDEPVRLFHDAMKQSFSLYDMVVLGVVNKTHENGVFNPVSLRNIAELATYAKTLRGNAIGMDDPNAGVIEADIIAPSTVDNIEQGGPGVIKFEWLMSKPPETEAEALAIRDKARRIPFLDGTLVSEDGKAICLYLPLTSKKLSYRVYAKLHDKIETLTGNDHYYITGLPVAEDTFGVEMFIQMALSAPAAMLVIFILLMLFFRKLVLIVSPLILALVCVICTMSLLVMTGNTIHIMSSMIPIFIMPIAVLDSVHILSEFFDRYQQSRDKRKTIQRVMESLFVPMLYTSLTSAAGFASLALTPIPPVQVFGIFVATGVMLAWVLTITFIPAFVMLIPERKLENFGLTRTAHDQGAEVKGIFGRVLRTMGETTYKRNKMVLVLAVLLTCVAVYGISKIQINDNPIKWFKPSHPIRVADRVLNEHFGGTYMAYLTLRPEGEALYAEAAPPTVEEPASISKLPAGLEIGMPGLPEGLLGGGDAPMLPQGFGFEDEASKPATPALLKEKTTPKALFKEPTALRYIADLQNHLLSTGAVGKSNSLTDIVKTVHRELLGGGEEQFRVPDSTPAVAQCLMQYQSSHRPGDLWHFVTPDYRQSSIWIQLKSGDNKDMERILAAVDAYVAAHPPPFDLKPEWFGLTYINVVWQEKMVSGMLQAFLGSFLVVLLMMILLFRSGLWGLLAMLPLTITIGLIYGIIGLIGKDYDMPVAVLSSLTLGMAVDFAIHFLARARELRALHTNWSETYAEVFGEPARAIVRNIIVIAVGFTPLLAASLVPYQTVGIFLASILLISGFGTLVILPALIRLLEPLLFPETKFCSITCQCGTCIMAGLAALLLVLVNAHQFLDIDIARLTWMSLPALPVLVIACVVLSRRQRCQMEEEKK